MQTTIHYTSFSFHSKAIAWNFENNWDECFSTPCITWHEETSKVPLWPLFERALRGYALASVSNRWTGSDRKCSLVNTDSLSRASREAEKPKLFYTRWHDDGWSGFQCFLPLAFLFLSAGKKVNMISENRRKNLFAPLRPFHPHTRVASLV